jgi:hypothetical protein
MGEQFSSMTAEISFGSVLAPVLSDTDDARIAIMAERLLGDPALRELDVVPLTTAPELTDRTFFAVVGDPLRWHALRLLIQQGKLPGDAPLPVRVFLNGDQWNRAGLIARFAEAAHAIPMPVKRRRAAPALSPQDLIRHLG